LLGVPRFLPMTCAYYQTITSVPWLSFRESELESGSDRQSEVVSQLQFDNVLHNASKLEMDYYDFYWNIWMIWLACLITHLNEHNHCHNEIRWPT
jgi:hypothetical protein